MVQWSGSSSLVRITILMNWSIPVRLSSSSKGFDGRADPLAIRLPMPSDELSGSSMMFEKNGHDRQFPVRYTLAQRIVVAEIFPVLSND